MKKIDFHVHILDRIPIEDSVRYFTDMCERKGYDGICVMALCHSSEGFYPNANRDAMEIKRRMPGSYAFGSLSHDEDFVEQAKRLMDEGFDGIKLLGGKPTEYRTWGYSYEHPRYEALFAYAEEKRIPLLIHNNDPLMHWDITKADARAIAKGWVYDEKIPSQEWFFQTMENVLARHPRLHAALAHMGFYADDLDRADRLLQTYPNLMLDITPALIIYTQLSETPARAQRFFEAYHDRLIYGTDAENGLVGEKREYNDTKTQIIQAFLEGDAPVEIKGRRIVPIRLEPHMLENIYFNNAMRFMKRQ